MSDDTTPDLLDLMAEALTVSFTGHPQRRFQALAANRVLAERMWPPVQAALDQRDASLAKSRVGCDSLRNRIRELEQAVCAGCMTREQQRDAAMEASRLNGVTARQAKAAWHREKYRADRAEAKVTSLLRDMATVARDIEDGEYGSAGKAARWALGIAPGVDLPGRES